MALLKELREKGATLNAEIQRMAELANPKVGEPRAFTTEEEANWKKVNLDYDANLRQIEIASRADSIANQQNEPVSARAGREDVTANTATTTPSTSQDDKRSMAMRAWCKHDIGKMPTDEELEACRSLNVRHDSRSFPLPCLNTEQLKKAQRAFRGAVPAQAEDRAMSAINLALGGAFVPTGFVPQMEVALLAYGGVMSVADIMRTDSGAPLPWPKSDDTANKGRRIGENVAVSTEVDPSIGQKILYAYEYTTDPIKIPQSLLEDSAFNLEAYVAEMFGIRMGRILSDEMTTGTGNSQPEGIVTGATSYAAASATAIAWDDVINLVHAIDPAYRTLGCGFMFHDSIMLILRKLKDGIGRYLWQSNVAGGLPDTIESYPYSINQSMDSTVSSGKKSILFGQLKKYKVRQVRDLQIVRLNELYRENNQVGFIGFSRWDGKLIDAGTHPIKYLSH